MNTPVVPAGVPAAGWPAPNGRATVAMTAAARSISATSAPSRRRTLSHLATAALVVLALAGVLVAIGRYRLDQPAQQPAILPAITEDAATPAPVLTETLLDTSTGSLPAEPGIILLKRLTFQPGPKALEVLPLTGPEYLLVQSGELTATTAATDHLVTAGSIFSPASPEDGMELRATGDEETVAFFVYLHRGQDLPFPRDPSVQQLEVLVSEETAADAGCPCRLHLERLTVLPGADFPAQEITPPVWFVLDAGVLGVTLEGENPPYGFASGQERTFRPGQYVPIDLVPPETAMTLRNAGNDPLILYRLSLTPGEASESTTSAIPESPE